MMPLDPVTTAAVATAVTAAYLYAGDFARYSAFTVGVFERVSHDPAGLDGAQCREHWCETTTGDGEHRQWFKEIVVLGVPIASYGGGSGYYCDSHADVSIQHGESVETRSVPDSVVWAIVWVVEKLATGVERPDDSAFDNVQSDITTSTVSALNLLPVLIIVAVGAAVLGTLKQTEEVK